MPVFEYKAVDSNGRKRKGLISAEGPSAARLRLIQDQLLPLECREATDAGSESSTLRGALSRLRPINPVEISTSLRQIATLVSSGLPLVDCLHGVIEQTEDGRLRTVYSQIKERVMQGSSLSQAMSMHPRVFGAIHVNMVKAAEAGGALDVILKRLADFSEKRLKLKKKMESAMAYPVFLIFISAVILIFLMSFVMPKVVGIFKGMHLVLPWATRALIWATNMIGRFWWLLLAGAGLIGVSLSAAMRKEKGRVIWDRTLLAVPLLGGLHRKAVVARFTRTLSILLKSGLPLVNSMEIARAGMGNRIMEGRMKETERFVAEGSTFSEPLKTTALFPPMVVQLVRAGEKSGELGEMLSKAAEVYEEDIETAVASLTSILEPLVILTMGVIVGFIVMAVLVPIFDMTRGIQ